MAIPRVTDLGIDEIKTLEKLRPYSVIVEKRGESAVAVDAYGRIIAGPSTDHASVIQAALQKGGLVFVKAGTYILNKRIVFDKNVALVGESASIYTQPFTVKFVVNNTTGGFLLTLSSRLENCVIEAAEGLVPDTAIQIEYAYFAAVRDVKIHGPFKVGIGINGYAWAFWNLISHVDIDRDGDVIAGSTGIKLYTTTQGVEPNENYFQFIRVRNYDWAVDIDAGNHEMFIGITLMECNNGIRVNTVWNEVYGIRDELYSGAYLVYETDNAGYNLYTGVNNNKQVRLRAGGKSHFWDLYHGTDLARIVGTDFMPAGATSKVVWHGLPVTPSKVFVTPGGNLGAVWVSNITSTTFTVNCSNAPATDTPFYWCAEA